MEPAQKKMKLNPVKAANCEWQELAAAGWELDPTEDSQVLLPPGSPPDDGEEGPVAEEDKESTQQEPESN